MFTGYKERNEILKELGFRSYKEYLDSELWKVIRNEILNRDACFCRLCGKKGYEVHHFTYKKSVLIGERPEALVTLCKICHQELEFQGSKKRPLKDVQRLLLEKITRTKMIKGISAPKIGRWFKNHWQMNLPIKKRISDKLEEINNVSLSSL